MPCFYCGKPISLVRRLADPDFCSEEHRKKYHELTRLALNRLVETRDHLEAAPKHKRQRGRAAEEPVHIPPVAELFQERIATVASQGQLSAYEDFAAPPHTVRIPSLSTPAVASARLAGLRAPGTVPEPPRRPAAPRLGTSPGGGFPTPAVPSDPAPPRLDLPARLFARGLPAQPLRAPKALQAVRGDGPPSLIPPILPDACELRLPSPYFDLPAGRPPAAALCAVPEAWEAAPPSNPPLPTLIGPTGGFPVTVPPLAVSATLVRDYTFELASQPPVGTTLPGAVCPPPAAPAPGSAAPTFMPPLPGLPAVASLFAPSLDLGDLVSGEPRAPSRGPAQAAIDSGRGLPALAWDIAFRHSSLLRLQPVQLEPPPLVVPAVRTDYLPIPAPLPSAVAGQLVGASLAPWRRPLQGLPRLGQQAGPAVLGIAPQVRVPEPGGQDPPAPGMARPASSPEFQVARQSHVGWLDVTLRRALGSAEPQALGEPQARTGIRAVSDAPTPGFRIVAWAFTHAPGLTRPSPPPLSPLLSIELAGPIASVGLLTRTWERVPAPPAAPLLPAWRAGLAAEPLPTAPAEPPVASYMSPPAVLPASATPAPVWLQPMGTPFRETACRVELTRRALPNPVLQDCAAPWTLPPPWPFPEKVGLRDMPMAGFKGSTRLPETRRLGEAVLAGADLAVPTIALTPVIRGPAAGPPPPLRWQLLPAASASLLPIRPSLSPPCWAPTEHWSAEPLEALAVGTGSPHPAQVTMNPPGVVRPSATLSVTRRLWGCAPPASAAIPSSQDYSGSRSLFLAPSVSIAPLPLVSLPAPEYAAFEVRLPVSAPVQDGGRSVDMPAVLRLPRRPGAALVPLVLPPGPGRPVFAPDLFVLSAVPAGPAPRNLAHAPHKKPKEVPIGPSILLHVRPSAPIPHRFERLPSESDFDPALEALGFLKRIPRRLAIPLAALVLLIVLAAVLWKPAGATLRQRAAVSIEDDFTTGMTRWTAGVADWARDPTSGFTQVGSLALLGPTLEMSDYRFDFQGQIDQQSLGWVFRARNPENYYAVKIVVVTPGPLPTLALARFSVLGGHASPPVQVPLRIMLHNESTFRVQMRVSGNGFSTFVNRQQVDFWSDDRLPSGGIGFFCEKGSRARLYWVRLTHQDDLLGRLCSYVAPNDLSRNGSWK